MSSTGTRRAAPGRVVVLAAFADSARRACRAKLTYTPMLGTRIGAFEIVRKIGQGGMGVVYEARHEQLSLRVAIKLLLASSSEPETVRRALAEAQALCAVQHPGVVRVSDFGQLPDGTLFLIMEYLEGDSLRDLLRQKPGPQPLDEALGIVRQVAAALAAVHARGIVHRDLSPANLLLVPDPELATLPERVRVKVLDFGIARFFESAGYAGLRNQPDVGAGTPRYMSPEQCADSADVGPPSDVYSLGVVLFELLAGEPLFAGPADDTQAVLEAHCYERPRPLEELRRDTPFEVQRLVAAMLAKRPERRPPMTEVADRLRHAQQELTDPTRTSSAAGAVDALQTRTRRPAAGALPSAAVAPPPRPGSRLRRILSTRRLFAGTLLGLTAAAALLWQHARPGHSCVGAAVLPGMACIAGGTFAMGSTDAEIDAAYADCQRYFDHCNKESYLRERPRRQVTLSAFLLGQYEVTNQQFALWLNHPAQQLQVRGNRLVEDQQTLVVDLAPDYSGIAYQSGRFVVRPGYADRPVVYVTWSGARAYCRARGFDLPTEAQWEWAARSAGPAGGPFPWGSAAPTCAGVVMARLANRTCKDQRLESAAVGSAPQDRTAQGIFDLGGNVEEWVRDRFLAPYPDCGDCLDPAVLGTAADSGPEVYAVRGGSWVEIPSATRAAARTTGRADHVDGARGFRCAARLSQ